MGWRKAIRDPIAIQAYEEFERMPRRDWFEMDNPYCLVAFGLTMNSNPRSPMSGYAVYPCEVLRITPRSVCLAFDQPIKSVGKGRLPKSPLTVSFKKSSMVKLLGWKTFDDEE